MTQIEILKKHFADRSTLSAIEAHMMYRIRALPRRISDLEEFHGMKFNRIRKTDPTGQRYVRYQLATD